MTFGNESWSVERWNRIFRAISAEPRRQLIVSLLDVPPNQPVPLPESATNSTVDTDGELLEQELYHIHLPLLADLQFVEWDTTPLVASHGPRFDDVGVVVDAIRSSSIETADRQCASRT